LLVAAFIDGNSTALKGYILMLVGTLSFTKPTIALGWYLIKFSITLAKFYFIVFILLKGNIYGSIP
jgi:hypothetical protein